MKIYTNKKSYLFPFFTGLFFMVLFWWTILLTFDSLWKLNLREYIEFFFIMWGFFVWAYISISSLTHIFRKWPLIRIDSEILYYKNIKIPLSDIEKADLFVMSNYYRINIKYKMSKNQRENLSYFRKLYYNFNAKFFGYHIAIPLNWVSQKELNDLMTTIS